MRIFYPPPPFGKIKNQDPFRRKTWTTGQISKTLRKFRNAIPPQKNKKSIFPPRKTSSTCLICKTFRNFEMQIFCPPPGKNKNSRPPRKTSSTGLICKTLQKFWNANFLPPLGKIKNHDPLGRRRRQGGVDIKWNGPVYAANFTIMALCHALMLSFLGSMFPQCPHPVASYAFDLTCRYLIKNSKGGTFYASQQVLLLTVDIPLLV